MLITYEISHALQVVGILFTGAAVGLPNGICAISFQLAGTFHSCFTSSSINGL